ncbi:MAG: 23S rRNA (uracil(1939)-C(5))-methyltransferase RlmD [Succinivibrio sp.]
MSHKITSPINIGHNSEDRMLQSRVVEVKVSRLNDKGQGIALYNDEEIYLEGVIQGEVVSCSVGEPFVKGSKRRPGEVIRIIKPSADRMYDYDRSLLSVMSFGPMTYEATLSEKQKMIKRALKTAGIESVPVADIEKTDLEKPSRYKSIRYFAKDGDRIISGFYKVHSHDVIEVDSCSLEPLWFSEFSKKICRILTLYGADVYASDDQTGLLRSLMLRDTLKGRMAVLVVSHDLDSTLAGKLEDELGSLVDSFYLNINDDPGNKVMSTRTEKLFGTDNIELCLCSNRYLAGPHTFLQVNYGIARKMYEYAVDWCGEDKNAQALDLCCGVGTMTLCLARNFKHVTGVEIVPQSIEAAKENASLNGIENVSFICSDIKESIRSLSTMDNVRAVICDPSRVGIGEECCKALGRLKGPVKLSYIFCSLKALERDIKTLVKAGFKVCEVKGFDMFPYSSHIETVVLMQRDQNQE